MTTQNGFQKHNIDHSSPSAVNMWAAAPCFWVSNYLFGNKGEFSHAAHAGVLVEKAVVAVLGKGMTAADAIKEASFEYAKATALGATDSDRKRGEGIPDMIQLALNELKPLGEPSFDRDEAGNLKQKKVELLCNGDGWQLPVIGFLDLHYPQHGLIIDLKTTMRMPSEMSDGHRRQKAVYQKFGQNQNVKFLYVTPKKSQMFETDDMASALADVKTLLNRQERFLRLGDKELLKSVVPVQSDSFYWNGNETTRKEMYGI